MRDGVRIVFRSQTARSFYQPRPALQRRSRRIFGFDVVREVRSVNDAHDVDQDGIDVAEEVLGHRMGRRVWVIREPESYNGLGILVTRH